MTGRIFVSGASGAIGGALVTRLVSLGYATRLLVRNLDKAKTLGALPDVELVSGDMADPESLKGKLDGCELVYHTAAKLRGPDIQEYYRVNVDGTAQLGEEAARAGVRRFVHLSSIAIYGYPQTEHITEQMLPLATPDPYADSKQKAEQRLQEVAVRTGLPVIMARLGDVFGPNQGVWTVTMIDLIKRGRLFPPLDSQSGQANLIYIENLLDAFVLLGDHPAAISDTFNAFNIVDTHMTMSQYIRHLYQLVDKRPLAMPHAAFDFMITALGFAARLQGKTPENSKEELAFLYHHSTFDASKIQQQLGWQPRVAFEAAHQRTGEWLRQQTLI